MSAKDLRFAVAVAVAVGLAACACAAHAATRHVYAGPGADTGDCTNAAAPCKTITYAMQQAVAGSPGDTVLVALGLYNAALGEALPITLKGGVQLRAGAVRFASGVLVNNIFSANKATMGIRTGP